MFLSEGSRILDFKEKPNPGEIKNTEFNGSLFSNAGIYILEPSIFDYIEEGEFSDFAKDIFPRLLHKGLRLYGYPLTNFFWAEIGNPDKYKKIAEHLKSLN